MTAASAVVATTEGEQAITRARAILAEDRGFASMDEQQFFRDAQYRLMEAGDRITLATLSAVCAEIDKRSLDRTQAAHAADMARHYEKVAQHRRERPQRWAALTPMERAGYLMIESLRRRELPLGDAFLRFATLVNDAGTAARTPPEAFEEER